MERRQFLAAACLTALAGCADGSSDAPTEPTDGTVGTTSGTRPTGTPDLQRAERGIPPDICEESIQSDPGIYAIDDPAFADDWADRDIDPTYLFEDANGLHSEQPVIGLTVDDGARAYPLEVLWTHEIVNDVFGEPVIVTYCPLCRSGMVAERRVDGELTTFGVSGLLWTPERALEANSEAEGRVFGVTQAGEEIAVRHNGNLVMYDQATRSYWSQILARAICGPKTGSLLTIHPSTVASWGEWQRAHPDTDVLLPPPYSGTLDRND